MRKKAAGTLAPSPDLRLAAIQAWTALSGTTCVPNDNVSAVPNDTVAQQRPPAGLQAAIRWAAAHSTAKAESCDSSDDELDSQNEIARGTNCPAPKGSIDSQAIENGAESWHELSAATTSTSSASSCSSSRRGGVAASEASALSPLSVSVSSPALSSASCSSEAGAAHVRTLSSICCNSHHTSMEDSSMCGRSAQFAVQDYLMHLRSQIEQETGQVETTKQHLRLAEEGKEHEKRRANDLAERLAAVVVENNLIKKELEAAHREIEAADRRGLSIFTLSCARVLTLRLIVWLCSGTCVDRAEKNDIPAPVLVKSSTTCRH
eukprot:SAG31_NODE_969_length_10677_cov_7.080072_4_plen_320_part_00